MTSEADAKLMASAPALLKALQRLLAQTELTHDYGDSTGGTLHGACREARAAVEKITT